MSVKIVHTLTFSVFAKEYDDAKKVEEALRALVPLDFEKEKIKVQIQKCEGFEGIIKVMTIQLTKVSHTNHVLDTLLKKLTADQKELLKSQTESRLDEELDYFIRFEKDAWVNERALELTELGNCIHCKLALAVYPKKRELAIQLVHRLLDQGSGNQKSI